jgi:hypothetical protein
MDPPGGCLSQAGKEQGLIHTEKEHLPLRQMLFSYAESQTKSNPGTQIAWLYSSPVNRLRTILDCFFST